jgi:serine/threonine protein kinase
MTAAPHDELVGTRVAGYLLLRCVAHDANAGVFEGVRDDARAAITIHAETEREGLEELASIEHPCVARVLTTGRHGDSRVVVSEWIEGSSLEARLGRPDRLAWPEISAIVRDVARGLGAIHAANVVHGDLEPSNIMLPDAPSAPKAVIVGIGQPHGSAHYRAPERADGGPIDQRADLYAVGVALHRMLTGQLPLEPVPPLELRDAIPSAAADLCLWLLATDPAQRVPNAHVLRLTLEALERSSPIVPTAREISA